MILSPPQTNHAPLEVLSLRAIDEIQPWSAQWNSLTRDVPFLRYEWLAGWWRHYGGNSGRPQRGRRLFVLAVVDESKRLMGLAPWCIERTATQGRVLKFLGGGEICSEYLSVLSAAGRQEAVAETLANWLTDVNSADGLDRWDALKLAGVEPDDQVVSRLFYHLARRGNWIERAPGLSRWRLTLPATWEHYLATLSKCHRKKLRRLDRDYFRTGRAVAHWVHGRADLERAMAILVDLHQRRWRNRGKAGCFASRRFFQFHLELIERLLPDNALLMSWLELDGRPVAAEYNLAGAGGVYAYQSGIAPESLCHQPGQLSNLASIRRAIERGDRFFDLLRGDEPYKAHWRATPRPSYDVTVVPSRASARFRHQIGSAGGTLQKWLKSGLQFAEDLING